MRKLSKTPSRPLRGALVAAAAFAGLVGCAQKAPAPAAGSPAADPAQAQASAPEAPKAEAAPPSTSPHAGPAIGKQLAPIPTEPAPETVVLEMNGETMTLAQLDELAAEGVSQARLEYMNKAYEARSRALNEYVDRKLIAGEVARLGLADEETFLRQQIDEAVPAPPEGEVRKFYDENLPMMGGASFEEVKPRIIEFLQHSARRDRFLEVIGGLREQAGVRLTLPRPRVAVDAVGPSKGPADAPVTVVMFSDFECPYCAQVNLAIKEVERHYGDKVRFVFRDFPLPFHPNAKHAAAVAKCADEQGKFWEVHDVLFARQDDLSATAVAGYLTGIEGLDAAKVSECVATGRKAADVEADASAALGAGVSGTPAFFINGIAMSGSIPFEGFKEVIDAELDRLGRK